MKKIRAFINGIIEFRAPFATYHTDIRLDAWYDAGRKLAHTLTLHRFARGLYD